MYSENRNLTTFIPIIKDFYYFRPAEAVNPAMLNMDLFKTS